MHRRSLTGMDGAGCSAGRFSIHSAMASFRRGASARPPGEALAELEGRWGRRQSWLSSLASEPSQTGPEGGADLPSPPGHQQRALGQAEGCVGPLQAVGRDPAGPGGLLFPASGLHTFTGNPAGTLARPADLRLLSPETSPCLLVLGSLGTRRSSGHKGSSIPQCPSHILRASGSLAQVWLGGEWEEGTAPEVQKVLSQAPQPSSSGWEPPGPTINISSVGRGGTGILQPSPSQSRV